MSLDDVNHKIDSMPGHDFEEYVSKLYENMGFKVHKTKGSGDYGADIVLIDENNEKTIIQVKRSDSTINNNAVQEIVSAMKPYEAKYGIVLTNNYFTKNAIVLATANNIELVNRDNLLTLIDKFASEKPSKVKPESKQVDPKANYCVKECLEIFENTKSLKKTSERLTSILVEEYGLLIGNANFKSLESTVYFLLEKNHSINLINASYEILDLDNGDNIRPVSKMQLFMDVLKELEGSNKTPVDKRLFVDTLEQTGQFTNEEANNYIRRMLQDVSIYESKPNHYNRV